MRPRDETLDQIIQKLQMRPLLVPPGIAPSMNSDFLRGGLGENGIPVAQNCHNSCETLSHLLMGQFSIFNQHSTGCSGSPPSNLRNGSRGIRRLPQKSAAENVVFNTASNIVSNDLKKALEGLETTFHVPLLIY